MNVFKLKQLATSSARSSVSVDETLRKQRSHFIFISDISGEDNSIIEEIIYNHRAADDLKRS